MLESKKNKKEIRIVKKKKRWFLFQKVFQVYQDTELKGEILNLIELMEQDH